MGHVRTITIFGVVVVFLLFATFNLWRNNHVHTSSISRATLVRDANTGSATSELDLTRDTLTSRFVSRANLSSELLQAQRWQLKDYTVGSVCSTTEISSGDSLRAKLCGLEVEEAMPTDARMVMNDRSNGLYYASRDSKAWAMTYEGVGFTTKVKVVESLWEWDVLLCLGLNVQSAACLKNAYHKFLLPHQRISYISGMRDILWRKDEFCHTIQGALDVAGVDSKLASYVFPCYVLPRDTVNFRRHVAQNEALPWMVKPLARGEGHGLFVATGVREIEQATNEFISSAHRLVQPFMTDPFLINQKKFDLRLYVLVTSISPLRAYLYDEGLVRFAASNYNKNATNGGDKHQYLTNTSIGKLLAAISKLTWTFAKLRAWFDGQGISVKRVWQRIEEAVVTILIASEPRFHHHFENNMDDNTCHQCFQLLGVDVILDASLLPKVIEVNGLPSMQLSHNQSDKVDLRDSYALRKLFLTADIVKLLFKADSVALEVAARLIQAGVGLKPGPLCNATHDLCVDISELQTLMRMQREEMNLGGFNRIFPSPRTSEALHDHVYQTHLRVQNRSNHSAVRRTTFGFMPIVKHLFQKQDINTSLHMDH